MGPKQDWIPLFGQGGPKGSRTYWIEAMDTMVYERRNESCRARQIDAFVELQLASHEDEIVGFKLLQFSRLVGDCAPMFKYGPYSRIPLCEILGCYRFVCLGANWDNAAKRDFVDRNLVELIMRFGEIAVFQPEYARTIEL